MSLLPQSWQDTAGRYLPMVAGESVITSGGYGLPDKTKIKIEAPEKNEDADTAGDKSDRKTADSSDGKTADKSGKKTTGKSKSSGTEKE